MKITYAGCPKTFNDELIHHLGTKENKQQQQIEEKNQEGVGSGIFRDAFLDVNLRTRIL